MRRGVIGEPLPYDAELLGGRKEIGEDKDKPELLQILPVPGEKETVRNIGDRIDQQGDTEDGDKAGFAPLGNAGKQGKE